MKKVGKFLGIFLLGVIGLAILVWFVPTILINNITLNIGAKIAKSAGIETKWDSEEVEKKILESL